MPEAYFARFIDDEHRWHPAQFENIYLLAVQISNHMLGVGDAGKRHLAGGPERLKILRRFRPHRNNDGPPVQELLVILTQLRHMFSAVGSLEPAV